MQKVTERLSIVIAKEHFLSTGSGNSIAITCKGGSNRSEAKVGFDQCETARNIRGKFALGCCEVLGGDLAVVKDPEIGFSPSKATLFSPYRLLFFSGVDLFKNDKCKFDPRERDISKEIAKLYKYYQGSGSKNSNRISDIEEISYKYGINVQYWPYFTEYESVCIMISNEIDKIIDNLEIFASTRGLGFEMTSSNEFPLT